ncbi:hypothetical protein BC832DRAFT_539040 [Gaertneriomyces semiglobifer]|nr:hypothetical protein BC832DRAFT_539040 [Gaertneriomyces semiglobifer]
MLVLQTEWASVDFQALFNRFSIDIRSKRSSTTTAGILNGLFLLAKLYDSDLVVDEIYTDFGDDTPLTPLLWPFWTELLVASISVINTAYLFWRSKEYYLFNHPTGPAPGAFQDPGGWRISSPNAQIVTLDMGYTTSEEKERQKKDWRPQWFSYFANMDEPMTDRSRRVWRLKVWDPPSGSTTLFCWLSPVHVAILYMLSLDNWAVCLPIALINVIITHYLVKTFQTLIRDRDILQAQVLKEYADKITPQVRKYAPPRMFHIISKEDGPREQAETVENEEYRTYCRTMASYYQRTHNGYRAPDWLDGSSATEREVSLSAYLRRRQSVSRRSESPTPSNERKDSPHNVAGSLERAASWVLADEYTTSTRNLTDELVASSSHVVEGSELEGRRIEVRENASDGALDTPPERAEGEVAPAADGHQEDTENIPPIRHKSPEKPYKNFFQTSPSQHVRGFGLFGSPQLVERD